VNLKVICVFYLLFSTVFPASTYAQSHPAKPRKKAHALATACIVEPLGITKNSDLFWEWTGNASSETLSLPSPEVKAASCSLRARPAPVFYLNLPTSALACWGEEKMEVTGFLANAVMEGDGSFSIHLQAVPQIMKDQKQGFYTGSFEVCLAYN
jgi:hypothetical protein